MDQIRNSIVTFVARSARYDFLQQDKMGYERRILWAALVMQFQCRFLLNASINFMFSNQIEKYNIVIIMIV